MKDAVIIAILETLTRERDALSEAVKAAHEAATHAESRAEDQYDTRGLEASYLASAQAKRVEELDRRIVMYGAMREGLKKRGNRSEAAPPPVGHGSLIELESEGKRSYYFLVREGGGITVKVNGVTVQVITPQSPLGEALDGQKVGDSVDIEVQGKDREYEILSIA